MVRGLTASSDGTAVGWMAFVDSDISFLCLRGARSAQAEVHGRRFARSLPWVEMAIWPLAGHHPATRCGHRRGRFRHPPRDLRPPRALRRLAARQRRAAPRYAHLAAPPSRDLLGRVVDVEYTRSGKRATYRIASPGSGARLPLRVYSTSTTRPR